MLAQHRKLFVYDGILELNAIQLPNETLSRWGRGTRRRHSLRAINTSIAEKR